MLRPIMMKINGKFVGWCVCDNFCILEELGIYETVSECEKAIQYYLEEIDWYI